MYFTAVTVHLGVPLSQQPVKTPLKGERPAVRSTSTSIKVWTASLKLNVYLFDDLYHIVSKLVKIVKTMLPWYTYTCIHL